MEIRPTALVSIAMLLISVPAIPAVPADDVDLAVVHRIKAEAFRNSRVMEHMFQLSDRRGPRLTNSPGYRAAAAWAVDALKGWGLEDAHLEPWGGFGRGWTLKRYSAHMREPVYAALPGVPLAWTAGTDGPVTAAVTAAPLFETKAEEQEARWDLVKLATRLRAYAEEHRGALSGKIVLISRPRRMSPPSEAPSHRLDEEGLGSVAESPVPVPALPLEWPLLRMPADPHERRQMFAWVPVEVFADFWNRRAEVYAILYRFLRDEGVVAVLSTTDRGEGGIAFADKAGLWDPRAPVPPAWVSMPPEPYSRLSRLVERDVPVKVEIDVQVEFQDDDMTGRNVIGSIPGGGKADEIIMLGGHLDSWHGGTGATDNAAGCAVALEAVRILKALDFPMERTVRVALWGGEEQGLFGSRGYVREHFGDPVTMTLKPAHAKLSGYFNLDNGTGKIRGVYLQGNDMMRPVFDAWLKPFRDLGADTVSIRNTRGTDHLSFDAVGLPGFQFIQDPLDYGSRTHHSDLDVVDHVEESDLMQAAAIMASIVYHAANREELLPRKPVPEPLPEKQEIDPDLFRP
jgi:carboxypeptidase Q